MRLRDCSEEESTISTYGEVGIQLFSFGTKSEHNIVQIFLHLPSECCLNLEVYISSNSPKGPVSSSYIVFKVDTLKYLNIGVIGEY